MSEDWAISELVCEIESLLGCGGFIHATSLYDRLKVVRRAIAGLAGQRDGQFNGPNHGHVFTQSDDDGGFMLPDLALACSRLRLDSGDLVEAVLSGMDAGFTEREAVTMSIIEVLQRRGAYHGRLKQAIDDGTIFQVSEGSDGDGGRPGRFGESRLRKTTVAPPSSGKRVGADDAGRRP